MKKGRKVFQITFIYQGLLFVCKFQQIPFDVWTYPHETAETQKNCYYKGGLKNTIEQ